MESYIVTKEITIRRQEGDTGSVVFVIPDIIDLDLYTEIKFKVSNSGSLIFIKLLSDNSISVENQTVTIPLLAVDTKLKSGNHFWELELSNDTEITTIGRGVFVIIKELIQ